MAVKNLVLHSEPLAAGPAAWLAARCEVEPYDPDEPDAGERLSRASGLIVRTLMHVDDALLDHAPNLRVVGRGGVGLDNIDVSACRRRGIEVVYTPEANTQAVVEYVLRVLTDLVRPVQRLREAVSVDEWQYLRATCIGRRELAEMTLGILGLGRIGRRVARAAAAIGMPVMYHDIRMIPPGEREGATLVDPETLFETADVISIHIDGRDENRGYIDERLIRRMKLDGIIINTARGFVLDAEALAICLDDNPDAAAIIDVHEPEPIDPANPLLARPNAHLYPHLASRTETALTNMSWVVRDVAAVLEGRSPRWPAP